MRGSPRASADQDTWLRSPGHSPHRLWSPKGDFPHNLSSSLGLAFLLGPALGPRHPWASPLMVPTPDFVARNHILWPLRANSQGP